MGTEKVGAVHRLFDIKVLNKLVGPLYKDVSDYELFVYAPGTRIPGVEINLAHD